MADSYQVVLVLGTKRTPGWQYWRQGRTYAPYLRLESLVYADTGQHDDDGARIYEEVDAPEMTSWIVNRRRK